jgi:hypothetical protein
MVAYIVSGRNFLRGGESVGILGNFLVKVGVPILGGGREKKLYKNVSFDPFWDVNSRKTL